MNQANIKSFSYQGNQISFENGDNVMVNATQMAKPFGKSAKDWLKTEQTKRYLQAMTEVKKILSSDLVQVIYGDNGGTWMHEDVAIEFARWLNPVFAIWCNDRIKELLKTGVTTVATDDETILNAMSILQNRLDIAKREQERLSRINMYQTKQLKLQAPKVQYVDNVLQSVNTYTTTQLSKELNMRTASQLHKVLEEKGVMYKQSGQWMLTAKYSENGYTQNRTSNYTRSDGQQGTNSITVWTETGRRFLNNMFNNKVN